MPFDSTGNFTRLYNWQDDRDAGIKIEAVRMDAEFDGIAAALNQVMLRTGASPATGDLDLGGNTLKNIGAGSLSLPSVRFAASPTTGLFSPSKDEVALAAAGAQVLTATSTGVDAPLGLSVAPGLIVYGPVNSNRIIDYATGATLATASSRWAVLANSTPESGANAGSNFEIRAYDDTGAYLGSPITINRAGGGVTVSGANNQLTIDGASATSRLIKFTTGGSPRWQMFANTVAESGTASGSDFVINRSNNSGAYLGDALVITRSNGNITLNSSGGGATYIGNGQLNVNGAMGSTRAIDFQTASVLRWHFQVDSSVEGGSNSGSDFFLQRAADNGTIIDGSFKVTRATNVISFNPAGTGGAVFNAPVTFNAAATSSGVNITASAGGQLVVNSVTPASRYLTWQTNGSARWTMQASAEAEGGSNAGSNFYLGRWNDSGTFIDNPVTITRSTGVLTLSQIPQAPTPGKQSPYGSTNLTQLATMQALTQRGMAVGAQFNQASGDYYPGFGADSGRVVKMTTANSVFLPGDGNGGTYIVVNTSSGNVGVAGANAPHNNIPAGGARIFAGDNSGANWCIGEVGGAMSNAQNGYEMSAGGVLRQWGVTGVVAAGGSVTVTLPLACPTGIWGVTVTPGGNCGAATPYVINFTTTTFQIFNPGTVAQGFYWHAMCH